MGKLADVVATGVVWAIGAETEIDAGAGFGVEVWVA